MPSAGAGHSVVILSCITEMLTKQMKPSAVPCMAQLACMILLYNTHDIDIFTGILQCRHPYQKYGYGLVFLVGLSVYAAYTVTKVCGLFFFQGLATLQRQSQDACRPFQVESFPVEHVKQVQVENTHEASKKAA